MEDWTRPLVAFVDPSGQNLERLEATFRGRSLDLALFKRSAAALSAFARRPPDAIGASMRVDATDGLSLLEASRGSAPHAGRVLFVAISEFEVALQAIERAGIDRYLPEPWRPDELVAVIDGLVRVASAGRPAPQGTALSATRPARLMDVIMSTLEARDPETRTHSERAAVYATVLGRAHGLRRDELAVLEYGALLHDLGKIGIDDHIFLKPGKLTRREWRQMRRHPALGYGMLSELQFLEAARMVVLQHHERWDGGGYPRGLGGRRIHRIARVFAVADTLDAMTSDRPYREALPLDLAWDEIRRCRGSQFDPAVVDTFTDIGLETWRQAIRRRQLGAD